MSSCTYIKRRILHSRRCDFRIVHIRDECSIYVCVETVRIAVSRTRVCLHVHIWLPDVIWRSPSDIRSQNGSKFKPNDVWGTWTFIIFSRKQGLNTLSNQLKLCRGEEVGGPKVREPRWFLAVIPFRGTGGPPSLRSAYQMVFFKYTHAIDDLSDRKNQINE